MTIVNSNLKKHYFYDFAKPLLGNGLLTADGMTEFTYLIFLNQNNVIFV